MAHYPTKILVVYKLQEALASMMYLAIFPDVRCYNFCSKLSNPYKSSMYLILMKRVNFSALIAFSIISS